MRNFILILVALIVVLAVVGLVVTSMRNKNREGNIARAEQMRQRADEHAKVLPEDQARAEEAEARAEEARLEAERARLEAERAEERATEVRAAAAQQEARHEDQVRAADRLDPTVNHKADDYSPSAAAADPNTIFDAEDTPEPEPEPEPVPEAEPAPQPPAGGGLPQRVRGQQEMPGRQLDGEWGGKWFKRDDE